jgi:hypothetical protein
MHSAIIQQLAADHIKEMRATASRDRTAYHAARAGDGGLAAWRWQRHRSTRNSGPVLLIMARFREDQLGARE